MGNESVGLEPIQFRILKFKITHFILLNPVKSGNSSCVFFTRSNYGTLNATKCKSHIFCILDVFTWMSLKHFGLNISTTNLILWASQPSLKLIK